MKKLFLFLVFIPLFSVAQEKVTLFIDSNINYAPIGLKLMVQPVNKKVGVYATAKMSEDFISRDVDNSQSYTGSVEDEIIFDVNEIIACAGMVFSINDFIDIYTGFGLLTGNKYVPGDSWNYDAQWVNTETKVNLPMISFGLVLTKNKLKFSLGNETAFAKNSEYPVVLLNSNSSARLSSFTFGIGYSF